MNLGDALFDALQEEAELDPETADVEEIAEAQDLPPRQQNRALADQLGVSIRTVQRWRAGAGKQQRRPSAGHRAQLVTIARRTAASPFADGARVTITGWIQVSRDLRHRTIAADVSPEGMRPVLRAYEAGDRDRAADELEAAMQHAYGPPVEFVDVDAVSLDAP